MLMWGFVDMNPETGSFARCVKHPSQFFTGFCSTCLVERLSNVDSVDEILEISESVPDSHEENDGVRARKTLLSLFEFDDRKEFEKTGHASDGHKVCYGDSSELCPPWVSFELSGSASFDGEKSEPLGDESLKDCRISLWLHSKLPMKILKWRSGSESKKGRMRERCKVCWEKPRHSWDGSMMSKALACSFSCLEEQQDGSGKIEGKGNNGILAYHDSLPTDGSFGDLVEGFHGEQPCQDSIAVSDVCRKKQNGWSRAWDWKITSPFRDFAKRNGHVLERSLSESWRNGNFSSKVRVNQSLNGDIASADVTKQDQKPELQKMREFKLSRSQSLRYSSPRNLDNGLLRFYLTPLRTSRRNTAKCRRRTSHSLSKGFLGP